MIQQSYELRWKNFKKDTAYTWEEKVFGASPDVVHWTEAKKLTILAQRVVAAKQ